MLHEATAQGLALTEVTYAGRKWNDYKKPFTFPHYKTSRYFPPPPKKKTPSHL
jgi:hypothetical protein